MLSLTSPKSDWQHHTDGDDDGDGDDGDIDGDDGDVDDLLLFIVKPHWMMASTHHRAGGSPA